MKDAYPEIQALAEVAVQKEGLWVDLPAEPWPQFVRLSPATTEEEVALVVGTLSSYGRSQRTPAQSAEDLVKTFPAVLPGGLAVVGSEHTVFPSCCCGLETWSEWLKVLKGGGSPWMGHDPSPLVEVLDGHVYVWSDGALGSKPESESPLVFTSEQFDQAVRRAARDIDGFMLPFKSWLKMHAPRSAHAIAEKFKNAFVTRSA
jgi:hypothetical protein